MEKGGKKGSVGEKKVKKEKGEKVSRSSNFSKEEERLLVTLVLKRKQVLISRASDQQTAIEKNKSWEEVAVEFNSACRNNVVRILL